MSWELGVGGWELGAHGSANDERRMTNEKELGTRLET